ncbi:hypothetical protein CFP56_036817 [Quercus suber]|uniref:RNase H type-1 domain-containing protein n=1 Tax=Quercus suber TaxID=58331 RepID=A0AAW0MAK6_QUESU
MNPIADSGLLEVILAIAWYIWKNRNEVNTNEATFGKEGWSGIDIIVRDDHGLVVAAMRKRLLYPLGPLEIEAKAVKAIVIFAKDIGI